MAFASGVFSRIHNFVTDKANAINVTASRVDAELDGIATALSSAVLKDGTQTVTANIPLSGYKLTGVGDPTLAQDAATKNYVDTAATFENTDVRCATTANITIATALNNGDTLDGLTLADGESVLVKNQTAAEENGIYVVSASPARDTAFDTFDEHVGAILNVQEGTANAGLSYRNTNNTGGTLDTTDITFEAFGGAVSRSSLGLATTDSPQFAGLNIGAATDTTVTRVAAGQIAVEGSNLIRASDTSSTTASGISEFATAAEFRTGTDTGRSLVVDQTWSAAGEVTLTDATTIAVDMSTFINATVTLGGNRTLGSPTNEKVGQTGFIRIVQDGTGSRTLAYGTDWEFAGGTAPTLTTTAADQDVLFYVVLASNRILGSLIADIS